MLFVIYCFLMYAFIVSKASDKLIKWNSTFDKILIICSIFQGRRQS